jgi:hypothetical protein
MSSTISPQPDPGIVFSELGCFQRTMAMKGAVELDLFTIIDNGSTSAEAIAGAARANARGVRILCDYLVVHGHLTKHNGGYGLTPTSKQFLSRNSRAYMGTMIGFVLHERTMANSNDIAGAVRRGGPATNSLIDEEPVWVEFAKAMAPMAYMTSQALAKLLQAEGPSTSVLDIAASHGYFGIAVALLNPDARVTALDSASVLEVARVNAERMGVSPRHHLLAGDAFKTDLGSGYDLALVTNFVHAFDREVNIGLLKRVHGAMDRGGRIALVEMVPNEDRVSPPAPAAFAMSMLVSTNGGDAYTFSELKDMLIAAGFDAVRMEPLDSMPQRAVIARA